MLGRYIHLVHLYRVLLLKYARKERSQDRIRTCSTGLTTYVVASLHSATWLFLMDNLNQFVVMRYDNHLVNVVDGPRMPSISYYHL